MKALKSLVLMGVILLSMNTVFACCDTCKCGCNENKQCTCNVFKKLFKKECKCKNGCAKDCDCACHNNEECKKDNCDCKCHK